MNNIVALVNKLPLTFSVVVAMGIGGGLGTVLGTLKEFWQYLIKK
jgi:hypothetical protein